MDQADAYLFFHFPHYFDSTPVSSVRAGDWKLLEYYEDHRLEMYNLREDLSETKDLGKTQPAKAGELQTRLHAWLTAVNAQLPTANPAAAASAGNK